MCELTDIDALKSFCVEMWEDGSVDQEEFTALLGTLGMHRRVVANQLIAVASTIKDEDEASAIAEVMKPSNLDRNPSSSLARRTYCSHHRLSHTPVVHSSVSSFN